jgi:glycosyltransferase involved in cell wall biosynthesis
MRILHVISSVAPRYGGPSTALREMCSALAARGHEVEVITTNLDGERDLAVPTGAPVADGGYTITYYPVRRPRGYAFSPGLARAMRGRIAEFDVVHIHSLYLFPTLVAARAARSARVPYVMRPHGTLDRYHRGKSRLRKAVYDALAERRNLRGAAGIHFVSEDERRQAGLDLPSFVIPLGVHVRPPAAVERERGLVTFVGRLSEKKGVDVLVDAFAQAASSHPEARLAIAGPDERGLEASLRERAAERGVADRVQFLGMLDAGERDALLARSAVFALPSAAENFGVSVVEALAAATPVVVTPSVATHAQIAGAKAGLVAERSAEAFAAAFTQLLDDPDEARELGENGRRLAGSSFGWDSASAQLEEMYETATRGRR